MKCEWFVYLDNSNLHGEADMLDRNFFAVTFSVSQLPALLQPEGREKTSIRLC